MAVKSWEALGIPYGIIKKEGQVYCKELVERLLDVEVGCHIDADIILTEPVKQVFDRCRRTKEMYFATSNRYCFDLKDKANFERDAQTQSPTGVSVFIANKLFWNQWYKDMPDKMSRFGIMDDQAILVYAQKKCKHWINFSNLRCVFHPNHESRIEHRSYFNADLNLDIAGCGLPPNDFI